MAKKFLLILLLLALLLMAADRPDTIQLKFINRSGYALSIWLSGTAVEKGTSLIDLLDKGGSELTPEDEEEISYYFTVPKGSRPAPTTETFEIVRGQYTITALYTKPWDPVYPNNPCIQHPPKKLFALHNMQITFTPCFLFPRRPGEPGMMKFWQFRKQILY